MPTPACPVSQFDAQWYGWNESLTDCLIHILVQIMNKIEGHEAKINPSRGLRQGDPLSPYLFIIGCEVLARLISRGEIKGNIRGVHLANRAPPITKLFYADDVMLFCNAKLLEIRTLLNCLDCYGKWSRQIISVEKSGIFIRKESILSFLDKLKTSWDLKSSSMELSTWGCHYSYQITRLEILPMWRRR